MVLTMTLDVDLSEHSIEEQRKLVGMANKLLQEIAEKFETEESAPEDSEQ